MLRAIVLALLLATPALAQPPRTLEEALAYDDEQGFLFKRQEGEVIEAPPRPGSQRQAGRTRYLTYERRSVEECPVVCAENGKEFVGLIPRGCLCE